MEELILIVIIFLALGSIVAYVHYSNAKTMKINLIFFGSYKSKLKKIKKLQEKKKCKRLIKILRDDSDYQIRGKAATALGEIGERCAIEPLLATLRNDCDVRSAAMWALDKMRWIPESDEDKAYSFLAWRTKDSIRGLKQIEVLLHALNNETWMIREIAVEGLGATKNDDAVEPLVQVLKNTQEYVKVRRAAADALGEIANGLAVKHLIRLLLEERFNISDFDVRQFISSVHWALHKMSTQISIHELEPLRAALMNKDRDIRKRASAALEYIGIADERVVEPLIQAWREDIWSGILFGNISRADREAESALYKIKGKEWLVEKRWEFIKSAFCKKINTLPTISHMADSILGEDKKEFEAVEETCNYIIDEIKYLYEFEGIFQKGERKGYSEWFIVVLNCSGHHPAHDSIAVGRTDSNKFIVKTFSTW